MTWFCQTRYDKVTSKAKQTVIKTTIKSQVNKLLVVLFQNLCRLYTSLDETENARLSSCVYTHTKRQRTHIKDPVVHVRVQWVMETLKYKCSKNVRSPKKAGNSVVRKWSIINNMLVIWKWSIIIIIMSLLVRKNPLLYRQTMGL